MVNKFPCNWIQKLSMFANSGGAKKSTTVWIAEKTKRAMTLKQVYWHSAISNLNFDRCHAHFDAILTKIYAFKQVLTFLELTELAKNGLLNINTYNMQ
jgi:hypothetical protein